MPFDASIVDFETPVIRTEASMLREMRKTLENPYAWCQYQLESGNRHCLYGALNIADHGNAQWFGNFPNFKTPQARNIHEKLARLTSTFWTRSTAAVDFNNSRSHTEVIGLIDRAITSFERR